jgi:hypothetical protein
MVVDQYRRAVGVLTTSEDAEYALQELKDSGFPMAKVGVLAKETSSDNRHSNVKTESQVATKDQEGTITSAGTGTALQGGCGFLVGFGTLAISGVGPTSAIGTQGTVLNELLGDKSVKSFADSWVKVLAGLGIPEQQASIYSERVSRGNYIVMMEGTNEEIATAEPLLNNLGIQDWRIYRT